MRVSIMGSILSSVVLFNRCQAKFLTCEIAAFIASVRMQSDIPGHAFRKLWLFSEISDMLRTC